jgi:hypothetical protein
MLFVFIFAILGMQLFGGAFGSEEERPRWHFDSFTMAFFTAFQILTYDSWNAVLIDAVLNVGEGAIVFFVCWIIIGSLILMNLLLVIVLQSFVKEARELRLDEDVVEDSATGIPEEDDAFSNPLSTDIDSVSANETFEVESNETPVDAPVPAASRAQYDGAEDDIIPFTIWVGGIPERCSSRPDHRDPTRGTPALKSEFSNFGEVVSMSVRRKEGDLKNWALITFVNSAGAAAALRSDVTVLGDDGMPVLLRTRGVTSDDLASAGAGSLARLASKQEKLLKRYRTLSNDSNTPSAVDSTGKESAVDDVFEKEDASKKDAESRDATYGRTLGIFDVSNPIRSTCIAVTLHSAFDPFVLLLIAANSLSMALETPFLDPKSSTAKTLSVLDVIFTVTFTVEALLKVIAFGLFHGPDAYLRGQWNRLDFTIVCVSWVEYVAFALDIHYLKSFRLLRAFRALRLLNKIKGLQQLVESLGRSMLSLWYVIVITLLVWLIFGIFFVGQFKGQFYHCTTSVAVEGRQTCVGNFADNGVVQLKTWANPPTHFDDIGHAMYSLYELSSQNDWIVKAHHAMDSVGVDRQPVKEANPVVGMYFLVFILISNFFFLNLFIGVIYEKYKSIKEAGIERLTPQQRQWLLTMRHIYDFEPRTGAVSKPGRECMFDLVQSKAFKHGTNGVILLNCLVMSLKYYDEPEGWALAQDVLNELFTVVFTVEAGLKIFALGFPLYIDDNWNRVDFAVVCISWVDTVVRVLNTQSADSLIFGLIRSARIVGRVARLFHVAQSVPALQIIFDTFLDAMPDLLFIAALVALIIYMWAILGMNLLGRVQLNGCLDEHKNFRDTPTAMLTLFGVATADGFTCMVHACATLTEPACSEAAGDCGLPIAARLYFMVFSVVIMFTTIEMSVNIIMSKFDDLNELAGLPVTHADMVGFVEQWKKLDPGADGVIRRSQLPALIASLNRDIGYNELAGEDPVDPHELRLPELPSGKFSQFLVREGAEARVSLGTDEADEADEAASKAAEAEVHFLELLYALVERKCGRPMPADNQICRATRQALGLEMPSIKDLVLANIGGDEADQRRHKRALYKAASQAQITSGDPGKGDLT